MRVLITRPREDAEEVGRALASRGFSVIIEPLIEIVQLANPVIPPMDSVRAILVTSANGVRALAAQSERRDLPLYAVGDATARTARELGYAAVASAGGDVVSLAKLVMERAVPEDGALLHVAGSQIAGDLSGTLTAAGFTVLRTVLYEAKPATALGPNLLAALDGRTLDAALFFSPRTAAGFVLLAHAMGRAEACGMVTAYGLSAGVATMLTRLPWRRLRVADRPTQESLLAAIDHDIPLFKGSA